MSIFESLGGNEYVSPSMQYRPPTKETFITGRTTTKWAPTSGSAYSGNNARICTFRLNGEQLLDGGSCYLNMTMKTPRGHIIPEDLAPLSVISAVRLTVGGSQAEQYSSVADACKPLVYHSCDVGYLANNASNTIGSWLYRPSTGVSLASGASNAITSQADSTDRIGANTEATSIGLKAATPYTYIGNTYRRNSFPAGFQATTLSSATRFTGRSTTGIGMNGVAYSIPLGLILGLFRTSQLLPLRVMGAIELTIEFQPPSRALIVTYPLSYSAANVITETSPPGQNDPTFFPVLDYELTQLSITGDLVAVSPAMAASLDALAAGDEGISLVIDTLATTLFPSQPGGASQQTLTCTRPYSNLSAQFITMKPSVGASSPYWPKSFYFGGSTFSSCQTTIGGLVFPSQAINSLSQAWLELRKALAGSRGLSLDKGCAIDASAYSCTYPSPYGVWSSAARGAAPDIVAITGSTGDVPVSVDDVSRAKFANTIANMAPACFMIGQSFSRVIGSGEEFVSLSGQNSRLSGYACQTNLQFRPYVPSNGTDPLANPAFSLDSALANTPMDYLVTQTVSVLIRIAQSSVMVSD